MSQKADVEKLVYEKSYKPKCVNPGSHNREQMSIEMSSFAYSVLMALVAGMKSH
jgi:hypothetical protein